MEARARIVDISRSFESRKTRVMIELTDGTAPEQAEKLAGADLAVTLKKWREKRSLDANAYYWLLLSRLAETVGVSKPFAHNYLLRRYGQTDTAGGRVIEVLIPESEEARERVDEDAEIHLAPTDALEVAEDGTVLRVFRKLKGSHTYDTREMQELVKGLVSECKELDIETATPDEIMHMLSLYGERRKEAHEQEPFAT